VNFNKRKHETSRKEDLSFGKKRIAQKYLFAEKGPFREGLGFRGADVTYRGWDRSRKGGGGGKDPQKQRGTATLKKKKGESSSKREALQEGAIGGRHSNLI